MFLQLISTVAIRMLFLGEALTTMLVYIWCRRNPYVRYNFFGLFTFEAPYLPWILVLISILFGGSVLADLVGKSLHTSVSPSLFWRVVNTHTHAHTIDDHDVIADRLIFVLVLYFKP